MKFLPAYVPASSSSVDSFCVVITGRSFWAKKNSSEVGETLPLVSELPQQFQCPSKLHYLGTLGNLNCVLLLHSPLEDVPIGIEEQSLRRFFVEAQSEIVNLLNLANHIYQWHIGTQFCSRCGEQTHFMSGERGKECKACAFSMYPTVSPCVIVAIVKDQRSILLAEIKRENIHFQSVLAGFVEAGETLEQAVSREVNEEVGIAIKNIQYFGSQPWSFSTSLMIGFTADYCSGEIEVDGVEVHFADWYNVENLPTLPPKFSIARQLIDWFSETYSAGKNNTAD